MANYTQYIPQLNSTTYPTSITNCFTALTTDVTALETGKLSLTGGSMSGIILNFTSTGVDDNATTTAIQVDNTGTAGDTRLLLYDVDSGSLVRVTVGSTDSGGAGYKVLRVPN